MEHWKPIPFYENLYEVSSFGRIKSLARKETTSAGWSRIKKEKYLAPTIDRYGRAYISLCKNYLKERWYIHRLVLTAFVGPCPDGFEACHNDGSPLNNKLENLRWDTHLSNLADKKKHGTQINGERHKLAKLTKDKVLKIRSLQGKISHQKLSEIFNVSRRLIGGIMSRTKWKHV